MKILAPSKYWGFGLVYSLTVVAQPTAARERRPNHSAGGPQGRLAAPRKRKAVLVCIYFVPSAVE